jgi:hypothetical protein
VGEFSAIRDALGGVFHRLTLAVAEPAEVRSLGTLKRYEDALDVLVCAWVDTEYLAGRTEPLGDADAAIWCPADVVRMDRRP